MEESQKPKRQNLTPQEKQKFQDEPFTFVEDSKGKSFSPLFWLQWGLLFVIGFYFISILSDGFGSMHKYGIQESTGINYIFVITKTEKLFFAALFLCLPAAFFFALSTEKFVKNTLISRLKTLEQPKNAMRTVIVMMLIAGVAISCITLGILKQSPISDDENVYLFQTRILAQGKLALDSKPGDDTLFEDNIFLVNNGKIFGQYPFGHSIIILLGYLLGFTHLTQILAAMLTVLAAFLLGRELYGVRAGLITALLITISPMFLFSAGTVLSHTNALFFLTWFGYFTVKTVRTDKIIYPILTGLAFGAAFHIRGATTLLLTLPTAVLLAFLMFRDIRKNLPKIICLAITVGFSAGLFLFINWYVNDNPLHTNYHAAWIGKTQFDSPFGFGKGAWRIIHSPTQGFLNGVNNFVRLNVWVFGWPLGILFIIIWAIQKGRSKIDFLLLLPIVLTFISYFFYFWPGISDTGPVLYFELLLPVALLSARGIEKSPLLLSRIIKNDEKSVVRMTLFVFFSIFIAFITFHYYNAKALAHLPEKLNEPYKEMKIPEGEKAVVFTDYYLKESGQSSWVAGRRNSHPDLGDNVIYLLDFGKDKNEVFRKKYYPDHKAYVFHYKYNLPEFIPLSEYEIKNYLKNYPDSR